MASKGGRSTGSAKAPDVHSKGASTRTITAVNLPEVAAELREMGPHLRELVDQHLPDIVAYVHKVGTGSPVTPAEKKVVRGGGIKLDGSKIIMGNGNDAAGLMTFGTEFGGQRRRHTLQFRPHRGRDGYMFWPNVRHHSDDIKKKWDDVLLLLIG